MSRPENSDEMARRAYRTVRDEHIAYNNAGSVAFVLAIVAAGAAWYYTRSPAIAGGSAVAGAIVGYFLGYRFSRLFQVLGWIVSLAVLGGIVWFVLYSYQQGELQKAKEAEAARQA